MLKFRHSASKLFSCDLKKYPTTSQLSKTNPSGAEPKLGGEQLSKPQPIIHIIDFEKIRSIKTNLKK